MSFIAEGWLAYSAHNLLKTQYLVVDWGQGTRQQGVALFNEMGKMNCEHRENIEKEQTVTTQRPNKYTQSNRKIVKE